MDDSFTVDGNLPETQSSCRRAFADKSSIIFLKGMTNNDIGF